MLGAKGGDHPYQNIDGIYAIFQRGVLKTKTKRVEQLMGLKSHDCYKIFQVN
jgi:hypothetical protein